MVNDERPLTVGDIAPFAILGSLGYLSSAILKGSVIGVVINAAALAVSTLAMVSPLRRVRAVSRGRFDLALFIFALSQTLTHLFDGDAPGVLGGLSWSVTWLLLWLGRFPRPPRRRRRTLSVVS